MVEITVRQWELLNTLVEYHERGALFDVIRPFPTDATTYVIYLRGQENMTLRHIGDLDVLCAAGYLDFKFSRHGNQKEFTIAKAAQQMQTLPVTHTGCASQLKQQLILLLAGDALTAALIEVEFIQRKRQSRQPNNENKDEDDEAVRRSLWKLLQIVSEPLVTADKTAQVAITLKTVARWMVD